MMWGDSSFPEHDRKIAAAKVCVTVDVPYRAVFFSMKCIISYIFEQCNIILLIVYKYAVSLVIYFSQTEENLYTKAKRTKKVAAPKIRTAVIYTLYVISFSTEVL